MAFDEWMTPPDFIADIKRVMSIDTDPASNSIAQEYIGAPVYYTKETNGLTHLWNGNVWLNPPYSAGNIYRFINNAVGQWLGSKRIDNMMILVNSATDTGWYHQLLSHCTYTCLIKGRIKFWKIQDGKAWEKWASQKTGKIGNSPRYLSTLFYFTREWFDPKFRDVFSYRGTIVETSEKYAGSNKNR